MRPFSDGDTFATFENLRQTIANEIEALDNDYVLSSSVATLEAHFIDKGSVDPLVLHVDEQYIESQAPTKIEMGRDASRRIFDGEVAHIQGTRLTIAIPFEGDASLWRIRASTRSMGGYPDIEIRGKELHLSLTFPDDTVNPGSLKRQVDGAIKTLADAVAYIAKDVQNHNTAIQNMVPQAIERKRNKALTATGAVAALGIPMKRADAPPTFTVPTKRRPSPVARPLVDTRPYEPEPTLDQDEYQYILSVMRSMALVIERNPASFSSLDEEAIRDHFLLQLNGHYEGQATGETFNASGKTDILIRSGDRNVFIAECKFWHGPKQFSKAIDQLLGYLTWRDSKTALIVFNRSRDSLAVKGKMHDAVLARPEYVKTLKTGADDRSYVLVKPSDPGREIILTTQVYDVPDRE